jgi:hypothetical protein
MLANDATSKNWKIYHWPQRVIWQHWFTFLANWFYFFSDAWIKSAHCKKKNNDKVVHGVHKMPKFKRVIHGVHKMPKPVHTLNNSLWFWHFVHTVNNSLGFWHFVHTVNNSLGLLFPPRGLQIGLLLQELGRMQASILAWVSFLLQLPVTYITPLKFLVH